MCRDAEKMTNPIELSIVMPCLNEAETLATCIRKARRFLQEHAVRGEIIVADNGSADGSSEIALAEGARLVPVSQRGYGNALLGGIREARGAYVIMGDADDSYDFSNLYPFLEKLRAGSDLVMGNRFLGGIREGAMPFLHRYLGNPVLSFIGRLFFKAPIGDFHCGLRGFRRDAFLSLDLRTTGMEFASEMVVKAALMGLKITEVPTVLSPDGRSRRPHLRTWQDGWRHLRFLLIYSPKWLFFYPGLLQIFIGTVASGILAVRRVEIAGVVFDVHTLLYSSMMIITGLQFVFFYLLSRVFAAETGLMPHTTPFKKYMHFFNLERGLLLGGLSLLIGFILTVSAFFRWGQVHFGPLDPSVMLRQVVPAVSFVVLGVQIVLNSFFLGILTIRKNG
jgi:glycosyltransferase involved in cell wall biosynthesis